MINVALLGFGRIGQMHAQNIDKDKNLKLLYVYEKVDRLGKKAKKIYNCIFEKNYKKLSYICLYCNSGLLSPNFLRL